MLNGAIMLPEPRGCGPCFTRITGPMRRYQHGVDPKVLVEHKRIVRGLIAGSVADLAGVRNGDEITKPVPQDMIQGQQDGILTLELLRDGKPPAIHYLPRGETVDAYQGHAPESRQTPPARVDSRSEEMPPKDNPVVSTRFERIQPEVKRLEFNQAKDVPDGPSLPV